MTVQDFFDFFLSDTASFGLDNFFLKLGNTEVSITPWSSKRQKLLKGIVPVSGVPFINVTRHEKSITVVTHNEN